MQHSKFIIIGGGILGASTAYHLAKNGAEVTLIDRKDKGQATDAAAGIICPWLSQRRNKAWYRLAKGGARIYPHLVQELASDGETETGYKQVGAISLHTDEKKLTAMYDRAHKRREEAPEMGDISLLNTKQTQEMFPLLSDRFGAVHVSGGARVDGRKLRDSLLRGFKKHGGVLRHGEATLLSSGHQVTGVQLHSEIIEAETVIATSGAWMNELIKPLGVSFEVTMQKAQILHLKIPTVENTDWPVVMPPNNSYLLGFHDQRLVVGSTHDDHTGFDTRVTAGGVHEILTKALEVAPALANSTVLETRVGFRPFTPGFLPVLGALPGYAGLLLANGLGASGLTMGPYVGTQLAKLALGMELEMDLTDYDIAAAITKVKSAWLKT
ncbi:FAD-binding oxidoreductase [Virgibacillus sp. NKC19-3]|uniref:NAD(P)/FAD-dependent oxidoreductase n=1 Tax=Virgibacillus saliphilus TaxID=2831674 RepID=UPI001C9B6F31|nr:FAD-binding oxidoreductase [Virgibacillus sp. NKC19-3]MBY7142764.1 FAD-binding oxidoreductase [Virgibacillus sp. NKC19-3]